MAGSDTSNQWIEPEPGAESRFAIGREPADLLRPGRVRLGRVRLGRESQGVSRLSRGRPARSARRACDAIPLATGGTSPTASAPEVSRTAPCDQLPLTLSSV